MGFRVTKGNSNMQRNLRMRVMISLILLTPMIASSFEVLEYKSGMSKQTVKSLASRNYQLIDTNDGMLEARGDGRDGMMFGFCNDRLSNVNIFWNANIKNLILVSSEFQSKYGTGITRSELKSLNSQYTSGPYYTLDMYWYKGNDRFTIMYGSQDRGDNMTVSYSTKTACEK